jgi:hypothetical protein
LHCLTEQLAGTHLVASADRRNSFVDQLRGALAGVRRFTHGRSDNSGHSSAQDQIAV